MRITWWAAAAALLACGSSVEKRGASDDPDAMVGGGGAAPEPAAGGEEAYRKSLRGQYCDKCWPVPLSPKALYYCLGEPNDCHFAVTTTAWLEAFVACECDGACALDELAQVPPTPAFEHFEQACEAVCNGPTDACAGQYPGMLKDAIYTEWADCLEESTCADAASCRHDLCPL